MFNSVISILLIVAFTQSAWGSGDNSSNITRILEKLSKCENDLNREKISRLLVDQISTDDALSSNSLATITLAIKNAQSTETKANLLKVLAKTVDKYKTEGGILFSYNEDQRERQIQYFFTIADRIGSILDAVSNKELRSLLNLVDRGILWNSIESKIKYKVPGNLAFMAFFLTTSPPWLLTSKLLDRILTHFAPAKTDMSKLSLLSEILPRINFDCQDWNFEPVSHIFTDTLGIGFVYQINELPLEKIPPDVKMAALRALDSLRRTLDTAAKAGSDLVVKEKPFERAYWSRIRDGLTLQTIKIGNTLRKRFGDSLGDELESSLLKSKQQISFYYSDPSLYGYNLAVRLILEGDKDFCKNSLSSRGQKTFEKAF